MSNSRIPRGISCPCGSGSEFEHCCRAEAVSNAVPHARPVPHDGAFLHDRAEILPKVGPITRVAIEYAISDGMGKAEVGFCYPLGTRIIMADGKVLPVEWLRPGMRFRLEDGGFATTTKVEAPKVWEPPSQERDSNGNSLRRIVGRVKYTGYYPRMDFGVPDEVIKTTPGHLFYSITRTGWFPLESFQRGEQLRNFRHEPVAIKWISPPRWEFCELYNLEVEDFHTYYVGAGPSGSILTHNGLAMGCRVPRAAVDEAVETGVLHQSGRKAAGLLTENELNPQHHIFPKEYRLWFRERGIDVDQYTARIPLSDHQALHSGGGPGRGGGWFSEEVMSTLRAQESALKRKLTPWEIEEQGLQFKERFGFENAWILPYKE